MSVTIHVLSQDDLVVDKNVTREGGKNRETAFSTKAKEARKALGEGGRSCG